MVLLISDAAGPGALDAELAQSLVAAGAIVARVDFAGTALQVRGGINANYAVTLAAVLYTFQLLGGDIPANASEATVAATRETYAGALEPQRR